MRLLSLSAYSHFVTARKPPPSNPSRVPIDLRRRADAKLLVSRIAADLFWRDGVAATRGEDIALAAGISTRTLWRYFRSKESCVEPVLAESGRRFMRLMHAWPLDVSLEEHLSRPMLAPLTDETSEQAADDVHAMRMIALGMSEPAIRSAWLMVCDAAEQEVAGVIAKRLGSSPDAPDVRQIAAAVTGAVRFVNDEVSVAATTGSREIVGEDVLAALGQAVRQASSGRLGDAIGPAQPVDPAEPTEPGSTPEKETTR